MAAALLQHEKKLLIHTVRQRTRKTPLLTVSSAGMTGPDEPVRVYSAEPCDVTKDEERMPINIAIAGNGFFRRQKSQLLLDKHNRRLAPVYVIDMKQAAASAAADVQPSTVGKNLSAKETDDKESTDADETLVSEVAIVFRFFQGGKNKNRPRRNENRANDRSDCLQSRKRKQSAQSYFSFVEVDENDNFGDDERADSRKNDTHTSEPTFSEPLVVERKPNEQKSESNVAKRARTDTESASFFPLLDTKTDPLVKRIAETVLTHCGGTLVLSTRKAVDFVQRFLAARNSEFLQSLMTSYDKKKVSSANKLLLRRAVLLRALINDPDFTFVSFPVALAERRAGVLTVRCGSGVTQESIFSIIGMLLELSNPQKDLSRLIDVRKAFIHYDGRSASWFLTECGIDLLKPTLETWDAFEERLQEELCPSSN